MEEKDKNAEGEAEKIQALRDMINTAEKTIQGAKSMLLQLEGKKKLGRKRKSFSRESEEGQIIEGTFDGQIMLGTDGKQYPVPANYASKSKLVEGDVLKLTITEDGSFIYKQIGPADRKRMIGVVHQDAEGNFFIMADGRPYRVLLASITYFRVEPGDEVTLVVPREVDSEWGAIENVLQKTNKTLSQPEKKPTKNILEMTEEEMADDNETIVEEKEPQPQNNEAKEDSFIDEWTPDLEALRKELGGDHEENTTDFKDDTSHEE